MEISETAHIMFYTNPKRIICWQTTWHWAAPHKEQTAFCETRFIWPERCTSLLDCSYCSYSSYWFIWPPAMYCHSLPHIYTDYILAQFCWWFNLHRVESQQQCLFHILSDSPTIYYMHEGKPWKDISANLCVIFPNLYCCFLHQFFVFISQHLSITVNSCQLCSSTVNFLTW